MDIFCEFTGLRSEGRYPGEMRFISGSIGVISGCTGSSHFKMGQTEVFAQIFGPYESRNASNLLGIKVQVEYADFAKAPHLQDTTSTKRGRELEVIIKRTFESAIKRDTYRNSEILISITVIQDDGSIESAAINGASLAIIDAGIPTADFLVSITATFYNDRYFLDSGRMESQTKYPTLLLALYPSTSSIVTMNMSARISPEDTQKLIEIATEGCLHLHQDLSGIVRRASQDHVTKQE